MSGLWVDEQPSWVAGSVVSLLGVIFVLIHAQHGYSEFPDELPAVVYGTLLPLAAAIFLTVTGFWIRRRAWTDVTAWRIVGWVVTGTICGIGVIGLLILYQRAEGVALSNPITTMIMFGTYGAAAGVLLGSYDVQRIEQRIQQEQEAKRLDEFASVVSHDLRNPLNVARGRLELARNTHDEAHLESVADAHDRMESLIDDLLALARESERALDVEVTSLETIARQSWEHVSTADATLHVEADRELYADHPRLQQLLENLFRNAIDHAGEDVGVEVGLVDDGFYVEDDGPGISPEDRSRVFDMGYSTTQGGTGFGLNIVAQVAEGHGWTVEITEGQNGGARFVVHGIEWVRND